MLGNEELAKTLEKTRIRPLEEIARGITVNSEAAFPGVFARAITREKLLAQPGLSFYGFDEGILAKMPEFDIDICQDMSVEDPYSDNNYDVPFMAKNEAGIYLFEVAPKQLVTSLSEGDRYARDTKRKINVLKDCLRGNPEIQTIVFMPYLMNAGKFRDRISHDAPIEFVNMPYDQNGLDRYAAMANIENSEASYDRIMEAHSKTHRRLGRPDDFYGERIGTDFMTNGPKYKVEKKRKK